MVESGTTIGLLLRLAVVVGTTCALRVTITPPNPPPREGEKRKISVVEKSTIGFMKTAMRSSYMFAGIAEIILITARLIAQTMGSAFLTSTCVEKLGLTSSAVVGCILACMGAAVRAWCYRALGRLFTFEFAILSNHKLITSGPYAFVRHPSYTGGMLALAGATLVYGTQGGMMCHCPVGYTVWAPLWSVVVVVSTALMVDRCIREDRVLHATFKRDWEEWRQRVRWRLIPWVF